jgi:hypothetical protein
VYWVSHSQRELLVSNLLASIADSTFNRLIP